MNENKISQRAIRKDAVLCDEWIITSDKAFLKTLVQKKQENFLKLQRLFCSKLWRAKYCLSYVHLDESTPHIHIGVVPMRDGKLSSKAMFDREELLNSRRFTKGT